jgi:AbrB family looped-hinge helix DNA binding protein
MSKPREYIHTVTRLGTVTIPIPIRRKYNISKGSRVKFVETEEGVRLIPLTSMRDLFGIDREHESAVQAIIREVLEGRK